MRTGTKGLIATLLALTLVVMTVMTVAATVYKFGYKTCAPNYTPYTISNSTGFTEHYPPGSGYHSWNNGSTWTVRKWWANQPGGGGDWLVAVTNGLLSDSGTYAGCQATGPG